MNVGTLEKRKNQLGLIDLFAAIAEKSPMHGWCWWATGRSARTFANASPSADLPARCECWECAS